MKLERELLFGLLHKNSTQTYYAETLKQLDCYYCCAFINNVQVFRETVLVDYLSDTEEYEMPTPENCDLLNKIEIQVIADKFFSNLNSTASFFCKFIENIKNTQNQFTSTQLKQVSLCLCQGLTRNHVLLAGKTPLIDYLTYHLAHQTGNFNEWTFTHNQVLVLSHDSLFNHYNFPPDFSICTLDPSVIIQIKKIEKSF